MIDRNRLDQEKGVFFEPDKVVKLPFILVATKDSSDNEVELSYGPGNRSLKIETKKPLKCIGDVDALMKLKFYRASKEWLKNYISERIMSLLPPEDLKEIFMKN